MIYYGTDITYGIYATYFLMGVVSILLLELIVLAIVSAVMKRKVRKLKAQYEESKKD